MVLNSPNAEFQLDKVVPSSSPGLLDEVYRLRYDVYVREMKLPVRHFGEQLSDQFDSYSTSFLLRHEGLAVGTIRMTDRRKGPLEIEDQNSEWNERVASIAESQDGHAGEVTRFIVKKEARGSSIAPRLLVAVLNEMLDKGIRTALGASKKGSMNRYHIRYGAEVENRYCCEYQAMSHTFGTYYLMTWNLNTDPQRLFSRLLGDIAAPSAKSHSNARDHQ